jgi:hypothetical protein
LHHVWFGWWWRVASGTATGSFGHLKFDLSKSKRDNPKQGSFPKGSEVLQKVGLRKTSFKTTREKHHKKTKACIIHNIALNIQAT